jgi:hypothetical protein
MRAFFAILLLLNLGLLAYQLWTTNALPLPARPHEINADKIVVLDPSHAVTNRPLAQASEAQSPAPTQASQARSEPTPVPRAQCLEWGMFEVSAVSRAEELLAQRLPEINVTRDSPEGVARFWVFIPAAGSLEETQARLARLQKKGAGDVVLVRDDPELRNAVSLGIFSSAAAAKRRLAELERLRIRGARVLERRAGGAAIQLLLRDVDPALRPNLDALVGEIPNTELQEIDCPATPDSEQTKS